MSRIAAQVKTENLLKPEATLSCDALVDTGAAYLALPAAWKTRLGELHTIRTIECEAN